MSTESITSLTDYGDFNGETKFAFESIPTLSIWFNESEITSGPKEEISITEFVRNDIDSKQPFDSGPVDTLSEFEAFILIEIVMTALELVISIAALIKIQRWRKNYRNQMLMQLSIVRFLKRLIFLFVYLKDNKIISTSEELNLALINSQFYIDFVIVIIVFLFIKHMYESLIIVVVRLSQNNLYKVLAFAWLLPLPVSAVCTAILAAGVLDFWTMYLLMCAIFRWPLILIGTLLYLTILYKVLNDRIRKFTRSLAVITFLLCLVINFYLFSRDVIELWCLKSFATNLTSYILGFLLNFLILCLYIILITLNFKCNIKSIEQLSNKNMYTCTG